MVYREIQGERVPALGFGTWQLTGRACREGVAHALSLGYRHLDTAQAYDNEAEVGQALAASGVDRGDVFLTTKVQLGLLAPGDVRRTTEESLRRLRTDYVDLLLIHWPSRKVPVEATLGAMTALRDEGKVRHVGVSNFTPALLEQALAHAPVFCNQVEYHPYLGQDDLLALARRHDLLLTAYSPLARGRVGRDDAIREIAEAHGKTPAQVTLRWLVQQEQVAAIPKAGRAEHREANFDLFDFTLSDDEMQRLSGLARGNRLIDPAFAPSWGE